VRRTGSVAVTLLGPGVLWVQRRAMVSREENDLITRVEGDAPMGRLMRENY
jgi:hypothetical protein